MKSVLKKNSQKDKTKPIFAEFSLANGGEQVLCRHEIIDESEIKKVKIKALIENQPFTLYISKNIKAQLDLPVIGHQLVYLASKTLIQVEIAAPVEISFENRSTTLQALVFDGNAEVRIGTITLDAMGISVDLQRQKLVINPKIHRMRPKFIE